MIIFYRFGKVDSDEFIYAAYEKYCGLKNIDRKENKIVRDKKPHFENDAVKFNLSHTKDLTVVAMSDNEVGIDVEKRKPLDQKLCKYLGVEDIDDFVRLEACVKYDGQGLKGIRSVNEKEYAVKNINFFHDYALAVCGDEDAEFVELKE